MKRHNRDYGPENNRNLKLTIGLERNHLASERTVNNFLTPYGITLPQFGVLEVLYHLGDMKVGELTEKTLSTSGCMTVIVKNMEKNGLVRRIQAPDDKRASLISLTEKGEELIERIFPLHLDNLSDHLDGLEKDEKETLISLLKKMSGV